MILKECIKEMENQVVSYLGKSWPIKAQVNHQIKKTVFTLKVDHLLLETPEPGDINYKKALVTFYKRQAKKHINQRLRFFQPKIRKKYKSFTIESNDKRWGSCNSKGELTFNWKLMIFPEAAIDYVVIHELCHLEHLNHDRSFWRLVGKLCPDYKQIMPILGTEKTR